MSWFECVPNFSEGRDETKIGRIVAEAQNRPGITVLDVEQNADHNRCVVTLVGEGPALVEAVLAMMRVATTLIDLTIHKGEHPRMGATDVVPFVPLGDATTERAVELAVSLGTRVWEELQIPVYLYGLAARVPERQDLAKVRSGQFEAIRDTIATDPARLPDIGEPRGAPDRRRGRHRCPPGTHRLQRLPHHPRGRGGQEGRERVRGRDGGLAEVKALGFDIRERQRAQVSMNLTDYRRTPIHRAVEAVRREAARYGVSVEETEVVGLVPEDALFDAAEYYLQLNTFDRSTVLERKVREAQSSGAARRVPRPPRRAHPYSGGRERLGSGRRHGRGARRDGDRVLRGRRRPRDQGLQGTG